MKLFAFLADLGSSKGAPGGGAAAALTGAVGIALVEMVARLNDKRLQKSSGNAQKAEALRKKLQNLISEDARAFQRIQRAYPFRKKNPVAWQNTLKNGSQPPLKIAELVHQGSQLLRKEDGRTSPWLKSDLMESWILLRAAYGSALLNVEINLKGIDDKEFNKRARKKLKTCQISR